MLIHDIVPKMMAEIGEIGKGHKNQQQNYNFRSVEDALNVLSPIFSRHGVTPSVTVSAYGTDRWEQTGDRGTKTVCHATLLMTVRLTASDGSFVESTSAGEGCDYGGDKATNKAMSAAFKYAMFLGLCIPVSAKAIEDSDRDDVRNEPNPKEQKPKSANPEDKPKFKDWTNDQRFAYTKRQLEAYAGNLDKLHGVGSKMRAEYYTSDQFAELNKLAEKLIANAEVPPK